MNKAPVFQHRHYKAIAAIIAALPDDDTLQPIDIRQAFAKAFERDNARFDYSRFIAAAKGEPSNGRDKVWS